jgi:hypothetical protein
MMRKRIGYVASILAAGVICVGLCGAVQTVQTIAIGNVSGPQGSTITVPVTLSVSADCTAALVRLRYDSTPFDSVSVSPGPLLSASHTLDSFSPATGRMNVCVYSPMGAPAFTAKTGVLFNLIFKIEGNAKLGNSAIYLTTVGTPALPNSNLVDTSGTLVTHAVASGSVTVQRLLGVGQSWMLYR